MVLLINHFLCKYFLYLQVFLLNLASFTVGLIFAWPSPCLPKLASSDKLINPLELPISLQAESWLASLAFLSASLGSILPTVLIKRLGRKATLLGLTFPVITAYLLYAFGSELWVFYAARLLSGVTLGATYQIVPSYVGEISETKNRGAMGCCFATFLALGQIFNFAVGSSTTFKLYNLLCLIVPISFVILAALFLIESPYDFVLEDPGKAEAILRRLRCNSTGEELKGELEEIKATVANHQHQLKIGDFYHSKSLSRSLNICVMLVTFQQLAGVNAIVSYMQSIFASANGPIPAEQSPIYVSIIQVVATLTVPLIVDRLGRKILLVTSHFCIAASVAALAIYFTLQLDNRNVNAISWLPLFSMFCYFFFFNTGVGSVTYVFMGEVFPANAKNVSSTITALILTLFCFGVTWLFPFLVSVIGMDNTFWITAGCCLLGAVLMLIFVPETKGKSFLEIQQLLEK